MQRALEAGECLRDLERQRERYTALIGGAGMRLDGMPRGSGGRSRTEELGVRLADLEESLQDEEMVYVACIMEARGLITRLKAPGHRRLLTLRYLCGMSWQEISDEIGYRDIKSVYRAHGWALQAAQDAIKKAPH